MEEELNKHISAWRDCVLKAAKALEEKNFVLYESLIDEATKEYEEYKRETALTYECKNFGMANYIFEDALPKLFKNNKKAVKEFINTIKEDKNLLSQFQFYKALEKNNDKIDTKEYVVESLEIATSRVNPKTINESVKKLNNIIKKYNIKPNDFISENDMKLFEDCHYVFSNKKKLNNLLEVNDSINSIVEYTKNNYNLIKEDNKNYLKLIENFEAKYNNLLTEEEKDFVKEIMDFKSEDRNNKKEKLFYKIKEECVSTIDKLLSEASDEDKSGLNAIKEQIMPKTYCSETLIKDMAKLLEIRDILLDK